ncbi:MFS transporter [Umezawaea endophytica]|uniref:MFS transporter n=1 Tax=Umezawaea endophytica TaxID=1654476 RepID=A0A9X2VK23_9PSEU|nr:MFS transporter [Umezawaea endophytica]MCS7477829.1 MFS transporter [Umezawaea endophytica]
MASFGRAGYLLLGQLSASIGTGAVLATAPLYLIRVVHLPAAEVAVGMAVVAGIGLVALLGLGPAVDLFGARAVTVVSAVVSASATTCFVRIDSLATFILFEGIANAGLLGMSVGQRALVGQVMTGEHRVRYQAYNRSVTNLGYAVGTLAAVPVLQADSRTAYLGVFFGTALVVGAAVPCVLRGPRPGEAPPRTSARPAITDVRYVVMTVLCGLLTARSKLLTVAIPLWVATHTSAPLAVSGLLLFLNTAVVVVLQVRFSHGAEDLPGAGRVTVFGGLAFVAAFALIALAGATAVPWMAIVLLATGVLLFTAGEMWTSAASWTYSYELADPARHGQYQAVFALGRTAGNVVGPLLAGVVAALGFTGWGIVAIGMLSCCVLTATAAPAGPAP